MELIQNVFDIAAAEFSGIVVISYSGCWLRRGVRAITGEEKRVWIPTLFIEILHNRHLLALPS